MPLDAAIGHVPALYCPGGRHGWGFWMKPKNTNKTQLLPCFLMVDWRKKAIQFQDPKQTLYSPHPCNKLCTNVKPYYLSWRAKLHFELSNVVNEQNIKKLLTLNHAQDNLWAKYGPIAVKLSRGRLWFVETTVFGNYNAPHRQPSNRKFDKKPLMKKGHNNSRGTTNADNHGNTLGVAIAWQWPPVFWLDSWCSFQYIVLNSVRVCQAPVRSRILPEVSL